MPSRKILLDECIHAQFGEHISGHDVFSVPQQGWAGLKNGDLLAKAQVEFDVFVTVDRNLTFQQNLASFNLGVIVLHAPSNRLEDLLPLVEQLLETIDNIQPGQTRHVPDSERLS